MHSQWLFAIAVFWSEAGQTLAIGFCLLCVAALVYYSLALYATIDFFTRPFPTRSTKSVAIFNPPVSILKPICGLDQDAYENLASFCRQNYPDYQIILGVQDPNDPSIAVVKQIIQDFPDVDIQLVISDRHIGANLKVSNLANTLTKAKHEILLLADSDIRVAPNYLQQVVQPLHNPTVGVVTCLYRSIAQGWLTSFEALSVPTDFLPSVLVARKLEGMTFALGATVAIRRSVLDEIGGFAGVANYLEDDYKLGNLPFQLGYQVVLSNHIVDHVMLPGNLADSIHHQTRWMRGSRFVRPSGYLGLIFTYGTVSSALFLLTTGGSPLGWAVLGLTWSVRLLLAWLVGVYYLQDPTAKRLFWLVPLRDFVSFGLWCYSFLGSTVQWRERQFRLAKGGRLIEKPSEIGGIKALLR